MGLSISFYETDEKFKTAKEFYDSWEDSWDNLNSIDYLDRRWAIKDWIEERVPDEDVLSRGDGDFLAYVNRSLMVSVWIEIFMSKPVKAEGAFSDLYYDLCTQEIVESDGRVISRIVKAIDNGKHVLYWADW